MEVIDGVAASFKERANKIGPPKRRKMSTKDSSDPAAILVSVINIGTPGGNPVFAPDLKDGRVRFASSYKSLHCSLQGSKDSAQTK